MSDSDNSMANRPSCPNRIVESDSDTITSNADQQNHRLVSSRSEGLLSRPPKRYSKGLKATVRKWSLGTQQSPEKLSRKLTQPLRKIGIGAGNFIVNHLGSVSFITKI